jgi:hypothetical protein
LALEGGLISYGPDLRENLRRGATYIDSILKGARPSDLPVYQPSRLRDAACVMPSVSMTRALSLQWTARCVRTIPRDGLRVVEPLRHQDEATPDQLSGKRFRAPARSNFKPFGPQATYASELWLWLRSNFSSPTLFA